MKQQNVLLILILFSFAFFNSCADEEFSELPIQESMEDDNARYAVGPGTPYDTEFICYNGGINLDMDCDGSYEIGWNHSVSSLTSCNTITAQNIQYAQNNGWCYEERDCTMGTCWKK